VPTSPPEPSRPRILTVGRRIDPDQPGEPELRLETVQRLGPELQAEVDALARAARAADGVSPFGEHKLLRLIRGDDRCAALLLRRGAELVGAAHCDAYHMGPASGACRLTAEVVVHPAVRGHGFGRRLLAGALDLARDEWADHLHLWAYGNLPAARRLAEGFRFRPERVLLQYAMSAERLPDGPEERADVRLRCFDPSRDAGAWLALHNRVFAAHREQGQWQPADLAARLSQPWFDACDLLLAEDVAGAGPERGGSGGGGQPLGGAEPILGRNPIGGGEPIVPGESFVAGESIVAREPTVAGEPVVGGEPIAAGEPVAGGEPGVGGEPIGFCWGKLRRDAALPGEIYVVGVDPRQRGRGLGLWLTRAGLAHIRARGRPGAMLYVEADNTPAIRLYESLGFERQAEHVCYSRPMTSQDP
jgi:mycothiol synthase